MQNGNKVFSFKEQLELGKKAESEFIKKYKGPKLHPHDGREYDFDREDGAKVELKTDTYDMDKTPNFFIERWSVVEKQKPGSVWQSYEKGVDVFVYYFINNGVYFEFDDLASLIFAVEAYVALAHPSECVIKNKDYSGMGWRVPREVLQSLYKEVKVRA